MDRNDYPHIELNDNGITIHGPDYPNGKVIAADSPGFAEQVKKSAEHQAQQTLNAIDDFYQKLRDDFTKQKEGYDKQVQAMIDRLTGDASESKPETE